MKKFKLLLVLLLAIFITACGGKEEKKKEGFSYEKKSTFYLSNEQDFVCLHLSI